MTSFDDLPGDGHTGSDAHSRRAVTGGSPTPETSHATAGSQTCLAGLGEWDTPSYLLGIAADTLDDLEAARIAATNRRAALTRDKAANPTDPAVVTIDTLIDGLAALEHGATLTLKRQMRTHPLGPWVKGTVGVGEKQAARLLAAIGGDPYLRPDGTPRTVSQLWAYCGYHVLHPGQSKVDAHTPAAGVDPSSDPSQLPLATHTMGAGVAPSRQRGQRANWSTTAKTRAYLIAEACIKQQHSPFRPVYDAARAKHADAVHAHECKRCGPAGHPAPVGSPLNDGHKHARAMRAVAKAVLKEMWREAARLHGVTDLSPTTSHTPTGAHDRAAGGGGDTPQAEAS